MLKHLALLAALLIAPVAAEAGSVPLLGAGKAVASSPAYVGPGDLVSGAILDYSLRGYTAADTGHAVNVCLPSDTTCLNIDVSGGALVIPGGLSTCNNSTVLCTARTIYDHSGALACSGLACDLTQATEGLRAAFVVPGAANGCTSASNYCLKCSGTSSYLSAAAVSGLPSPYTLSSVAVRTSGTSYSAILAFNASNDTIYYGDGAGKADLFAGADHLANQTDASWHAIQWLSNGASSSINVDGVQTTFTASARSLSNLAGICDDGAGDTLTGSISELIAWPSAISAGNITAVNSNQHTYWGF